MARAKGSNRVEEMVGTLREWQGIERQAMDQTAEIMEKTSNPFIRVIMEIIRQDSLMHHRVQQVIIDSLRYVDGLNISAHGFGKLGNFQTGISRVTATVIKEVADIMCIEDLDQTFVFTAVFFQTFELVAA